MINSPIKHILWILCIVIFFSCKSDSMNAPFDLKCEYLESPIGIDTNHPRLSWKLPLLDKEKISEITIWLSSDSTSVISETPDCWHKTVTSDNVHTIYDGASLESYQTYYWKIGYRTESSSKHVTSPITSFVTGVMTPDEWKSSWINDGKDDKYLPSPYFRKDFEVKGSLKSAWLIIASAGLYEASINGKRIGDHFLDPMFTRFDKRILSVMYDVKSHIQQGENVMGVQLGNGWYNHQSTAVWFFDKAPWRNRPCFTSQLRLEYTNGETVYISTDNSWRTTDSPVIFNSIYTAEHYDARKEIPNWNKPDFDASYWNNAQEIKSPTEQIDAQLLTPIREIERLKSSQFIKLSDTHYIYHFPRNIAGIVELKAKGEEGTTVRLKHGEMLNEDGTINMGNIDYHYRPTDDSDPFQTDIVILSGGEDFFTPKFNYKGFKYVEITSSKPLHLTEESLVAIEMHSDVPQIGYLHSSSELVNKIWEATNSSYLANLFGYPTDCPQREKNGWTGDGHIAIETGLFSYDAITVYEKWMNDFLDEQKDNGVLPCIIPTAVWGYDWANGVDWTSAVAIIPWEVYRFYGDDTLLKRMYPAIKKYVGYIESIAKDNLTDWGLGDWIPVKSQSDVTLTTSIYYYTDVLILYKAAKLFGYTDDMMYYEKLSKDIKNAINTRFLNTETGVYANGTQTEQAMPLYWKVVPEKYKTLVAQRLNERVEQDGHHIDVGLLGSKALLNALSENGYAETAYTVATQETYPSWGYWIKNGATTLRENWRVDVIIDNSLNHIMFGEIGAWFYKALGGMSPDEAMPGFKKVILKPHFVDELEHIEVKHESPYGWIISKWRHENNEIIYEVDIPAQSTAILYPPTNVTDKESKSLEAGKHIFRFVKK